MTIFNKQYQKLKGKKDNFKFEFNNKIPISRGLGSSSAVIVAALVASYVAAGERYNKRKILNMALEYEPHPDNITPAIMGGFNVAFIEDKKIYNKKRKMPDYLRAVLVVPNKSISTAKSRKILPSIYRKDEVVYSLSRSSFITSLFMTESWDLLKIASKDKLHQNRRMQQMPELFSVPKNSLLHGALMRYTIGEVGSYLFHTLFCRRILFKIGRKGFNPKKFSLRYSEGFYLRTLWPILGVLSTRGFTIIWGLNFAQKLGPFELCFPFGRKEESRENFWPLVAKGI